ncbi:hypothetical protein AU476_02430 [Cupriavidus sp. UYMSc13B]|nr:hypothetical protein AU476_02430 [Cupriavidus sp. UYMSc13B]
MPGDDDGQVWGTLAQAPDQLDATAIGQAGVYQRQTDPAPPACRPARWCGFDNRVIKATLLSIGVLIRYD